MSCPNCGADDEQIKYRDTPKIVIKTHPSTNIIPSNAIHEERCKRCNWYSIARWDGNNWMYKTKPGNLKLSKIKGLKTQGLKIRKLSR